MNGRMVEASKYVARWRREIAAVAKEHMQGMEPTEQCLEVDLEFYFPRPKTHLTAAGDVKATAPTFRAQRPDVDKLTRAVLDACTGIVYADDSQVVCLVARKEYGEIPGVNVYIQSV